MDALKAIIMGLVQGATEFLPVSSSGHLVLFGRILGLTTAATADADPFLRSYATMLHMGTLLAVIVALRKELLGILKDLFGKLTWLLVLGTIPAVVFAVLLGDVIDQLFTTGETLGFEFIFTGLVLLVAVFLRPGQRGMPEMRWTDALVGGVGQALAILPAVSRSGCTLVPLLALGVERKAAIRFTFLLSIPAILGGFALDVKGILSGTGGAQELLQAGVLNLGLGIAAAAVAGFLAIRLMLNLLHRRGFLWFGIYTVALGAFVLLDQNVLHWIF